MTALLALVGVALASPLRQAHAQATCAAARSVTHVDSVLGGVGLPGDSVAIVHRRGAEVLLRILPLYPSSGPPPQDTPLDLDVLGGASRAGSALLLVEHSQSHAIMYMAGSQSPKRLELPPLVDEQSGVGLILAGALGSRPLWRVNALRDSMPWGATVGAAWLLGNSFAHVMPTDTIIGAGATDRGSAAGSHLWLLHGGDDVRLVDGAGPTSVVSIARLARPATQIRAANDSIAWIRYREPDETPSWEKVRRASGPAGPLELPAGTTPLTTMPDGALVLRRRESDGLRLFRCE